MDETLNEYLEGRKVKGFTSRPRYFRDGDFVSYYLVDEDHYAERVDELLTVYRSMKDRNRLVGCKIKGVSRILETLGSFAVSIHDGNGQILLGPLFLGSMALARNPSLKNDQERRSRYEEVRLATRDVWLDESELQPA